MAFSAPNRKQRPAKEVESTVAAAKRYLGWLLSRREYAASELRTKALTKGYSAEHTEAALQFVQQHGLQDDERYAGMKARQSASRKGDRLIAQTLRAKKLDEGVIQAQLDELPEEAERAWHLLERFQAQSWSVELKQRAWRRLAGRGFSADAIKAAVRRLELELRDTS